MVDTDVIRRMDELLRVWEQQADRRSEFLRCYRMMTENTLFAIEADEFHDGPWVRHLLHHFADYYVAALADYEHNRPGTPAVWSTAHRTAGHSESLVLQNLLLGINAHINYDLVLTLYDMLSPEWAELSKKARRRRYDDYRHINEIIGRTIDEVQDTIVAANAPLMNIVDKVFGPLDEWSTSRLLCSWREEVWQHAQQMLAAQDHVEREQVRRRIEELTLRRSQVITELGGRSWLARLSGC